MKKTTAKLKLPSSQLKACGLSHEQIGRLIGDYNETMVPIILEAARRAGKIPQVAAPKNPAPSRIEEILAIEKRCADEANDEELASVIENLPPAFREKLMMQVLQRKRGVLDTASVNALLACRHDWSDLFARAMLPLLVRDAMQPSDELTTLFENLGSYFPPTMLQEFEYGISEQVGDGMLFECVFKFMEDLRFKSEIYAIIWN